MYLYIYINSYDIYIYMYITLRSFSESPVAESPKEVRQKMPLADQRRYDIYGGAVAPSEWTKRARAQLESLHVFLDFNISPAKLNIPSGKLT